MTNCVIHPLPIFEGRSDRSTMTHLAYFGIESSVIGYAWYIEGPKQNIVVDAGCDVSIFSSSAIKIKKIQTIEEGLSKFGLTPGDIDIVIVTHLHHDHIGSLSLFPEARILVQKAELEFARNPHPVVQFMYRKHLFENVKFDVLEGDTKICDEISVLFTPGHTPGVQSVSIGTSQGKAIITGFCCLRDNFEIPPEGSANMLGNRQSRPLLAPAENVNLFQAYDSLVRVKEAADIVIPVHESSFKEIASIP